MFPDKYEAKSLWEAYKLMRYCRKRWERHLRMAPLVWTPSVRATKEQEWAALEPLRVSLLKQA